MMRALVPACLLMLAAVPPAAAAPWQDALYDRFGIDATAFIETRAGFRIDQVENEKDMSIGEVRLQGDLSRDFGWGILKVKGELIGDQVLEEVRGELRELNLLFSPLDTVDVKVGRQILTWGTGDLLFINDNFPKDWESFFIGRDDEYLKAPSDAIKVSVFLPAVNVDFVYTPVFAGSRYIDGERLSYWNPLLGRIAGRDSIFDDDERNRIGDDADYSVRLYRTFGDTEAALYGYHGFWSTPEGLDMTTMRLIYPKLTVVGASVRRPVAGGIGNLEIGYYDSRDDEAGDDPLVRNSELRVLAGFEHELGPDFTGSVQYYLEWMQDYDAYERTLAPGSPKKDEYRHLLTLRLTKLLLNQNLTLSLFVYYSPSDRDSYWRPKANYKLTDHWTVEAGANLFFGSNDYTFWGQFQDNSNAYASIRYAF